MAEHRLAGTENRSVIGIMNEFGHLGSAWRDLTVGSRGATLLAKSRPISIAIRLKVHLGNPCAVTSRRLESASPASAAQGPNPQGAPPRG
jgi:hypothetical protein